MMDTSIPVRSFKQTTRLFPCSPTTALLGIMMFAIAIRGGGPYSVDRVIGKEL